MKKYIAAILLLGALAACNQPASVKSDAQTFNTAVEEKAIAGVLDSLNARAARADLEPYFALYTDDAVFAGTDATERWEKPDFKAWAKPIFATGSAWNFSALQRKIYFDRSGEFAWFDELLNTQMKICRGSGVLVKENGKWLIKQYILSMTIPNEKIDPILSIKGPIEEAMISKMNKK